MSDKKKQNIDNRVMEYEPETPDTTKDKIIKISILITPFILALWGAIYFFDHILKVERHYNVKEELELTKEALASDSNFLLEVGYITTEFKSDKPKKEYLTTNILLRFYNDEEIAEIKEQLHVIKDALTIFLATVENSDFNRPKTMDDLKEAIITETNKVIKPFKVREILFKDMMIKDD